MTRLLPTVRCPGYRRWDLQGPDVTNVDVCLSANRRGWLLTVSVRLGRYRWGLFSSLLSHRDVRRLIVGEILPSDARRLIGEGC